MRTRYFHEDDYCQQELLPLSAWDHCAQQIEQIDVFAGAHRTEFGWSDIYVRQDADAKLSDLGILAEQLASAIARYLPRFEAVNTGYSSHVEPCPDVIALGADKGLSVFLGHGKEGRLEACWIDPSGATAADAERLAEMFVELPNADRLLFVDWAWSRMFRANDAEAWRRYLHEHASGVST